MSFRQNMPAYHNSPAIGYVKAGWVSRGPGSFSFNPAMTVHFRIYLYLGAMVLPADLRPFLSVYIHHTDFVTQ